MVLTANFDRSLELDQDRLRKEYLARSCAELADFLFTEQDLFTGFRATNLKETIDNLIYVKT